MEPRTSAIQSFLLRLSPGIIGTLDRKSQTARRALSGLLAGSALLAISAQIFDRYLLPNYAYAQWQTLVILTRFLGACALLTCAVLLFLRDRVGRRSIDVAALIILLSVGVSQLIHVFLRLFLPTDSSRADQFIDQTIYVVGPTASAMALSFLLVSGEAKRMRQPLRLVSMFGGLLGPLLLTLLLVLMTPPMGASPTNGIDPAGYRIPFPEGALIPLGMLIVAVFWSIEAKHGQLRFSIYGGACFLLCLSSVTQALAAPHHHVSTLIGAMLAILAYGCICFECLLRIAERPYDAIRGSEARLQAIEVGRQERVFYELTTRPGKLPRFVRLSGPLESMFGVSLYTALQSSRSLFRLLDSHELARLRVHTELSVRDWHAFELEVTVNHVDGERRLIRLSAMPRSRDNGSLVWNGVLIDIGPRVAAKRQIHDALGPIENFRVALDEHAIVAVTDLEGLVVDVNDRFCDTYQFSREEVLGNSLSLVASGRHPQEFYAELWHTIGTGKAWHGAICNQKKDGSLCWVQSTIVPLLNAAGPSNRYIAIYTDISNQRETEEDLRVLNSLLEDRVADRTRELEAIIDDLDTFTLSASHDLKAPARNIEGLVFLLREVTPLSNDEARFYLSKISLISAQMRRTISDLLGLARLRGGPLQLAACDLTALVLEVRDSLEPEYSRRNIRWEIEPLPVIQAEAGLIRQVFINLLSNAIKFTRDREQAVIQVGCFITTRPEPSSTIVLDLDDFPVQGDPEIPVYPDKEGAIFSEGCGKLVIFVRDNGAGFDGRYATHLFEAFHRQHGIDEFEGTGLGLTNVKRIVARHGGRVWASASVGRGARFCISLPLNKGKI